ncbi:MAG: rane protein, partial [Frankiales bacterium]|nr:rane protein [Frankiales bacterium]
GALGGAAVGGIGSSLVSALATVLLTGVLTAIAGRGVLGKPMTLGEAWAEVRPALWRLLGVAFLTALLVYGSLVAGITVAVVLVAVGGAAAALIGVPLAFAGAALAVYLYCRLALAPCAALLERAGVLGSMRRSGVLVRHSWWRVFGVLLLAVVVASVVGQIVQVPFLIFGVGSSGLRGLAGASSKLLILTYVGAGIAQTVIAPFTAGVRALLYVDRRMRAEGLDVALTAAAAQRVA